MKFARHVYFSITWCKSILGQVLFSNEYMLDTESNVCFSVISFKSHDPRYDKTNYAVLPFGLIQLYCAVVKIPFLSPSSLDYSYI